MYGSLQFVVLGQLGQDLMKHEVRPANKSIWRKSSDMVYQIALGLILYRFQIQHDQHFHWEQPANSLKSSQPGISEVHQFTQACQLDLCEVEAPVDPSNGKPSRRAWFF